MAKPTQTEFKKYLNSLNEDEIRAELQKLFSKLTQVQEFYAQELLSGNDRKAMLSGYKMKIYEQYWTRGGNPKTPKNAEIRKMITAFQKTSVFPHELIDLLIYHTEITTKHADKYGGSDESAYKAACTSFEKAMKLIVEHKLMDMFQDRCKAIFKFDNLDYWYIEWLEEIYEQYGGGA
jgi:Family of unknown function (DUF6155)